MAKQSPPVWFKKVSWDSSVLDLSEFGWGQVTLRDAAYRRAHKWFGAKEDRSDDVTPTAILFQAYVRCGTDTRIPPEGANVVKWKEFLEDPKTPNKVVYRIYSGINWFAKLESLADGTSGDEDDDGEGAEEGPKNEVERAGN